MLKTFEVLLLFPELPGAICQDFNVLLLSCNLLQDVMTQNNGSVIGEVAAKI
jgi:hypothetical protein